MSIIINEREALIARQLDLHSKLCDYEEKMDDFSEEELKTYRTLMNEWCAIDLELNA